MSDKRRGARLWKRNQRAATVMPFHPHTWWHAHTNMTGPSHLRHTRLHKCVHVSHVSEEMHVRKTYHW